MKNFKNEAYTTEQLANMDLYYCDNATIASELDALGFNYTLIGCNFVFIATPKLLAAAALLEANFK